MRQEAGRVGPDVRGGRQQGGPEAFEVRGQALYPGGVLLVQLQAVQQRVEVAFGIQAGNDPVHDPQESLAHQGGAIRQSRLGEETDGRGVVPGLRERIREPPEDQGPMESPQPRRAPGLAVHRTHRRSLQQPAQQFLQVRCAAGQKVVQPGVGQGHRDSGGIPRVAQT